MTTTKERLEEEFRCAIVAILGDQADKEFDKNSVDMNDLILIANKVAFYLDLR